MQGVNQSSVIVGAIAIAFIVYITLKGELPIYLGLLLLGAPAANPPAQNASQSNAQAAQNSQASVLQYGQLALTALAVA